MKILEVASNSQVIQAIKKLDELTEKEKRSVSLTEGSKLSDYSEFWVHYNKQGQINRVLTHKLASRYKTGK